MCYVQDYTIYNNKEQQSTVVLINKKCMQSGTCVPGIEELDCSRDRLVTQYQQMVEKLLWTIEVKRVDLTAEVLILSSLRLPLCEEYIKTTHQVYMYGRKMCNHVNWNKLLSLNRSLLFIP